jgi:MFS family permease
VTPRHVALRETVLTLSLTAFFSLSALMVAFMPVVAAPLQERFALSASQIGLLTSAYLLGYALVELPAGMAAARWGGRLFAVSGLLLIVGSLVFAFAGSFAALAAGRLLQGLGAGMNPPVGSPVLARAIRPHRLSWAWGIMGAGWGAGTIVGLFAFPSLAKAAGFRAVPLAVAGLALVLVIVVLTQRAVRIRPARAAQLRLRAYLADVPAVARRRDINLLGLFNATSLAVAVGAVVWTPVFLTETRGAGVEVGAYVTAMLGFAQIAANPFGAWAEGRVGRRPVILWSQLGLAATVLLVPFAPGVAPVLLLVLLVGFFDMSYFAPLYAAVPVVVDLRLVGLGAAWVSMVGIVSSMVFPWLFGALLDAGLGYASGYAALAAFALIGALATPLFLRRSE